MLDRLSAYTKKIAEERDSGQHPGVLYKPRDSKMTLVIHGFHTTSRSRLPVKDHRFGWERAGEDCRLSRHRCIVHLARWPAPAPEHPAAARAGQSRFDLGHGPLFSLSFSFFFILLSSLWPLSSLHHSEKTKESCLVSCLTNECPLEEFE